MQASSIGTAQWVAAQREAREARRIERIAALDAAGIARGERSFDDVAAPSGVSERNERRGHGGYNGDTPTVPLSVRRTARAGRIVRRAADHRAAVMSAARARASVARRIARMALPSPLEVEWQYIERYPRPLDRFAALDEWYCNREARRREYIETMQAEPNRDGRGTVDYSPDAVNGTEVRHTHRWQSTPRDAVMTVIERRDGIACVAPVDWRCYRVEHDGSRTALVTTATAKRRKRHAAGTTATAKRAALQAAATTAGHVDSMQE